MLSQTYSIDIFVDFQSSGCKCKGELSDPSLLGGLGWMLESGKSGICLFDSSNMGSY